MPKITLVCNLLQALSDFAIIGFGLLFVTVLPIPDVLFFIVTLLDSVTFIGFCDYLVLVPRQSQNQISPVLAIPMSHYSFR